MKIAFCGEYNSANFGDGVIGLGLSSIIDRVCPDAEVKYFDLSGRSQHMFPSRSCSKVKEANSCEFSFKRALRRFHRIAYAYLSSYASFLNIALANRKNLKGFYYKELSGVDFLIIGGGQLLMDNRLSFPIKLRTLVECAQDMGIRVGFFSVGVGRKWSSLGVRYLKKIITSPSVQWVSCRDPVSADRLRVLVPMAQDKIHITVDSALGLDFSEKKQRDGFVGLGVISPLSVRANGVSNCMSSYGAADFFWCELYKEISSNGRRVVLFCNGSEEDALYLRRLEKKMRLIDGRVSLETFVPESKEDLVGFLSSAGSIVAARMHANIVAFSLGVPSVALVWDDKIVSFMKYVGRGEFFLQGDDLSARLVLQLIEHERFHLGINPEAYKCRIDEDFRRLMRLR